MTHARTGLLASLSFVAIGCVSGGDIGETAKEPVAPRRAHRTVLHGVQRDDDWFWLRDRKDPAVQRYLQEENAFASAWMRDAQELRDQLYREMSGRLGDADLSVPWRQAGWLWYSRIEPGKQYPLWCRRRDERSDEQVVLDVDAEARGKAFLSVTSFTPSPSGDQAAFLVDDVGARDYALRIRVIATGQDVPDRVERVSSFAWASDGRTLLYTAINEARRPSRLMRHVLGGGRDELVLEERDERFNLAVSRSRDGRWLVVDVASRTTTEVLLIPANRPSETPRVVRPRMPGVEYDVEPQGNRLLVRTNEACRNFRVLAREDGEIARDLWEELVPCRDDVAVEGVHAFRRHVVLQERRDAIPRLTVLDSVDGSRHEIEEDEAIRFVAPESNAEFETTSFRYTFGSFTTPPVVVAYDMERRARRVLKRTKVEGGFDPADYTSERRYAVAPDGTRIPISIVYRKTTKLDGTAPILLTGYGAYGYPLDASFSYSRPSLLDRGFVFAVAHVRGGGELGPAWHDEGRMLKKRNTFTDFIAVAESLVAQRVGARKQVAIESRSAGGLLLGAVVNMRPDLWAAVLAHVPFVDVVNTMVDESLPLTVNEYEEWGNPRGVREEFDYLRSYGPYENVRRTAYPPMLVKTALEDRQVMYWEPAKWVAKLRATRSNRSPLLLVCNTTGGHSGSSGRLDRLKEAAFDHAWLLRVLESGGGSRSAQSD